MRVAELVDLGQHLPFERVVVEALCQIPEAVARDDDINCVRRLQGGGNQNRRLRFGLGGRFRFRRGFCLGERFGFRGNLGLRARLQLRGEVLLQIRQVLVAQADALGILSFISSQFLIGKILDRMGIMTYHFAGGLNSL